MTKRYQKEHPASQKIRFLTKKNKSRTLGDFGFCWYGLQLYQILKPIRLLFCKDSFCTYIIYISISKLYVILISRDSKNQKVGHHPPPTIHLPQKKNLRVGE